MQIVIIRAAFQTSTNEIDSFYTFALTKSASPVHTISAVKDHIIHRDIHPCSNITYAVLETPAPPEGMTLAPIDYAAAIINTIGRLTDKYGPLDSMQLCIIEELTRFLRTISQINAAEHSTNRQSKKATSKTIHQVDPEAALLPYEFQIEANELSNIPLIGHTEIINEMMATLGIRFRLAIPQTITWTLLNTDDQDDDEDDEPQSIPAPIIIH